MQVRHNGSPGRGTLFGRQISGCGSESVMAVQNDETQLMILHLSFPAKTNLARIPSSAPMPAYPKAADRAWESRDRGLGFDTIGKAVK